MICPTCNGKGISDVYINGHFKACEYCNGTGEIFQCPKCGETTYMNNIGSLFDHDYAWYRIECPQCGYCSDGGTDPQKAIDMFVKGMGNILKPLTNEEWFIKLPTEKKAEIINDLIWWLYPSVPAEAKKVATKIKLIEWLNEVHTE